jgi:hypothetical protein
MMATTGGWLRNVNAAVGNPMKMPHTVPSGLNGRLRE